MDLLGDDLLVLGGRGRRESLLRRGLAAVENIKYCSTIVTAATTSDCGGI